MTFFQSAWCSVPPQRPAHATINKHADVKLTEYKIIKVEQWSGILEPLWLRLPFARLASTEGGQTNVGGGARRCKSATWLSLQQFTLQGITPKPCQNNWNANQIPGGDFGPLGRRNQASLVLWLSLVEWDIDLGSTFCKYLPRGRREGPSTTAERKQPRFLFNVGAARVWLLLEFRFPSLQPIKLMMG